MSVERLEDRSLLAATLVGTVWHDLNTDGQQTGGEPAIQYAVAELFSSTNGTVGDADDVSLGTRITDSAGNYQFTGLAAGVNHFVVVRPPVGYAFTWQDTGPDATDSDVGATGVSEMFAPADLSTVDLDAGLTGAAPAFGWAAQQGGALVGNEEGYSVVVDAAGNSYMTGAVRGSVDFDPGPGTLNLTSAGTFYSYVAKFTARGALVWARQVANSSPRDVAVDSGGNVLVTGVLVGTADFDPGPGTFNLTPSGFQEVFVWKLTGDGEFAWAIRAATSTSSSNIGYGIAVDTSGDVVVTGMFRDTTDFDPGVGTFNLTTSFSGDTDIFVWKLTSAGELSWAVRAGSDFLDEGFDVAVDATGDVLVTGRFDHTVDFDPGPGTFSLASLQQDAFVWKLTSAGQLAWAARVGGAASADAGNGVAVDASGNVLVTGFFQGTADFDPGAGVANLTSAGGLDIFVWKLTNSGNFTWARRAGGTGEDTANGLVVDADGNALVTGSFIGTVDFDPGAGTVNLTSAGFRDIFAWKLTSAGDFGWAKMAGGSGFDWGRGIAVDLAGTVSIVGSFESTLDFDPGVGFFFLTSAGGTDGFLWRLNPASFLPPTVTGVFVRGTGDASGTGNDEWQAGYVAHLGAVGLGDAALGYRVSVGADQLDTLPWTNVDTVSIRFSEGVTITSGHLQVIGAAEGPAVPSVASFSYNASTFTATWQFATPLPANKYLLHLASGAVVGLDTLALDGEWTDGVSTASGNAAAGGAFSFRMNVVPGDVNGDAVLTQSVTNADVLLTKQRLQTDTSDGASFAYRRDVNGSGFITNPDVLLIKQQQSLGTSIFDYSEPVPPPPGESFGEESLAAARLTEPWHTETEPWHTETSSTDAALAEPVAPEGTIDPAAWDAAILAMYGKKK